MNYKGVLKRLLPFAATFFVAVFITSFFVDLHRPRFGEWRARRWERRCDFERMMRDNEELRNENLRLRNELQNNRNEFENGSIEGMKLMVPAPPLAPAAPIAPRFR